jgi:hypothetical protein
MEKRPLVRIKEFIAGKKTSEPSGFSLQTDEGVQAVANLSRLATREVTLEELDDDRYGVEPDGTLRLDIDDETFDLLSGSRASS